MTKAEHELKKRIWSKGRRRKRDLELKLWSKKLAFIRSMRAF